jgi:hypothetical protein
MQRAVRFMALVAVWLILAWQLLPCVSLAQGGSTGGALGKSGQELSGDRAKETAPETAPRQRPPTGTGERPNNGSSVGGHWRWSSNCALGSFSGTFQLSQAGANSFNGTVRQETNGASGTVTRGSIQGNRVSFTVTLSGGGWPTTRVEQWSGSLSGSRIMQGTATTPSVGSCSWSASRE